MFLLTTFDGSQKVGQIELPAGTATIGSDPGNTIVLSDSGVSREHARLEPQGNLLLLRDLGSANGTLVNNRPAEAVFLEDGDLIRVGRFELRLKVIASASPGPAAPGPSIPAEGRPPAAQAAPARGPEPTRKVPAIEAGRLEELRRSINSSIARRFRTLLAVLEGNLPLLHPVIPEETFEANLLKEIERTCLELCSFADQFIELAEMESRSLRGPARTAPTPPATLVRRAIGLCSENARNRRILISDRLPRELPPVIADGERLQRALSTILLSLVNLSSDGAILTIEGRSDGRGLRIDFSSDEGPALAVDEPGDLPGEDPIARFTSGEVPGAGLSLAIARQIALEHGGDLLILKPSRDKGRGACFSLRLPLAPELLLAKLAPSPEPTRQEAELSTLGGRQEPGRI